SSSEARYVMTCLGSTWKSACRSGVAGAVVGNSSLGGGGEDGSTEGTAPQPIDANARVQITRKAGRCRMGFILCCMRSAHHRPPQEPVVTKNLKSEISNLRFQILRFIFQASMLNL